MELKDYWTAVVAGWKFILVTLLVALATGAAVAVATPTPTPQYTSVREVFLLIPTSGKTPADIQRESTASQARSYAELASGSVMADRVAESLGEEGVEGADVAAVAVPETTVLELTVTHTDEDQVEVVADAYVDLLDDVINEVDDSEDAPPVSAKLISAVDPADSSPSSGTARIMLVALMLGLGVGVGGALLRHSTAQRRTGPGEVPTR